MNQRTRPRPFEKLSPATNRLKGLDVESLEISFVDHIEFSLAKDRYSATPDDCLRAMALTVRDRLAERWIMTQQSYYNVDAKRAYYLSMEFLMGRAMGNALLNLGLYENAHLALFELGLNLEELREAEPDAALGNGGLGRLAACFLDSMATLELPGYGYGIRYEHGLFVQRIVNGNQVEAPDNWLRFGNPWEFERPEYHYTVKFYGRVNHFVDAAGRAGVEWVDTSDVLAVAYDTPIPGYQNNTVNNLRLWGAKGTAEFNLDYFNHGDYVRAIGDQLESEAISKALYPKDDTSRGKELRLKQEYFLVSATLQDIVRRYKKAHDDGFASFPDKVAIQLNDTHPSLAVPELMRLLVDMEGLEWGVAWDICVRTFGYTNHTVLPEALEQWSVSLLERLLPRHLEIIYEVNRRFLEEVASRYPGEVDRLRRMSVIQEGPEKSVRMAHLAIIGSHAVNGVAELHSRILRERLFRDFVELTPEKFGNKTNGITPRRWLMLCNWELSALIRRSIGDGWTRDLNELKKLEQFSHDGGFQAAWREIRRANKRRLAEFIFKTQGISVNPDSLFDCQVKRIHEYKRQLLNVLHAITLYNRIKADPQRDWLPRTILFGGKAAPGYFMAKLSIALINAVARVVNDDPDTSEALKVVFLPEYTVSLAQKIIPAADLSEQISTAGMEASGTGNMKFALNGALTIGTLDGANIEIGEEVGADNIFVFGLTAEEVARMRDSSYNPRARYEENEELRRAVDMISCGFFSPSDPGLFWPIVSNWLDQGDYYMVMADYAAYVRCQDQIAREFLDTSLWTRKSILNTARVGKFSSDRTIKEYATDIWGLKPVSIKL